MCLCVKSKRSYCQASTDPYKLHVFAGIKKSGRKVFCGDVSLCHSTQARTGRRDFGIFGK